MPFFQEKNKYIFFILTKEYEFKWEIIWQTERFKTKPKSMRLGYKLIKRGHDNAMTIF